MSEFDKMNAQQSISSETLQFPDGFVWGTATAGHQVEGGNKASDWWEWETLGLIEDGTRSGRAVDYWNRFEEDHALMASFGLKAFRLGIEWSRIEPERGKIDKDAVVRYHKIFQSLRRHNIKICLTIYHWVLPAWVAKQGDWLNPKTLCHLEEFAKVVLDEFGEYPDLWITLNEPMVPAVAGNLLGLFPPQRRSLRHYRAIVKALLKAHASLYELIHTKVPLAPDGGPTKVGVAQAYPSVEPWGSGGMRGIYERGMSDLAKYLGYGAWDSAILSGRSGLFGIGHKDKILYNSYDFCGINYYYRTSLRFDGSRKEQFYLDELAVPDGITTTDMGWQIYPEGLYGMLEYVWRRFQRPIYITENGIADSDDRLRPSYILRHVAQIYRAIQNGIPVCGYYHWSFIDNFEWREGFAKKFGLIEVDHTDDDLERKPRPSAELFGEIIKTNGITKDMVKKYAPEAFEEIFGTMSDE